MEIKEVLHFYIGQQVLCSGFEFIGEPQPDVTAIIDSVHQECVTFVTDNGTTVGDYYFDDPEFNIKPILRKLSDMTEEEGIKLVGHQSPVYTQVEKVASSNFCFRFSFEYTSSRRRREWTIDYNRLNPEQFHYLLKQGFDLFGLCDAGLAIDNKSL